MPFTPFHFGPGLLLGILLFPFIDFGTLIIASVILDIEPLVVIVFGLPLPLHGFFHTYLGATIASIVLAACIYPVRNQLNSIVSLLILRQHSTLRHILLAGLIGTYFHVFLDSFLYTEMNPFWPLLGNPFLGIIGSSLVYSFCTFAGLVGFLLYVIRVFHFQPRSPTIETASDPFH
jgi:membrane-bound metal-dependent hydrolase YbcI (DUF457 family)